MTSSPRAPHAYRHRSAADSRLPASGTEDSLVARLTAHSCARKFKDPHDVTWWVHMVSPGVENDVTRRGRLQAVMLRFQNGTHSRYLHPIPADWRECDDRTLWGYCEQAVL